MNDWIKHILEHFGALGVGMLMLIENLFPPIPSEVVMPWAGYSVSQGHATFLGVVAAGSFGSFLGATFWYLIAKWVGKERLTRWIDRHGWWLTISKQDIDRTDAWFRRWGGTTVLVCRMIPGVRTLISVPAGFVGMSVGRFALYTAIGTILWTVFLAGLGWWLGENYDQLATPLGWVSTLVVLAFLLWWLWRLVSHGVAQRRSTTD